MLSDGTIIALSTPQGIGAIGVIRLSGPLAFEKTALFFTTKGKKIGDQIQPNQTLFGNFIKDSNLIDEVLVTPFKGPHSYTGEDVVEISCHGSPFILQQVISCFLDEGIKPAKPGEFTLRAYLNKKMDLSHSLSLA